MKSLVGFWIDKRGLKNKFIAKELEVTQVQVSKWRTGKAYPRLDKAFKLATLLDVKVDDLYEQKGVIGNSEEGEL
ncbi:helix-turn-helix transcriptional regulator [Alkalihalophilus marmarensis]|uniref:helix-turn-helix transcriptional regulator n=1 Tax=Alkalihalophilus marmarensis TaxID=521377 RepID=UPI002E1AADBA|nr:helix-turn-helix transcriptional regulator [Alkalihalophilus marmarensis]